VPARGVEVWRGLRLAELLKTQICEPLAMADTGFYGPADKAARVITMYAPEDLLDPMKSGMVKADDAFEGQYNRPRTMLSGGGGLVSTVSDYLSFLRMLINGGEYNGARILTPEALGLVRTNQLADGVGVRFPTWEMPGTVFGLGFALKQAVSDNEPGRALDEYHWGGMAGRHSWMAPQANIAGMCMTQRMPGFWHPFSHEFKKMAYGLTDNVA